MACRSETIDKLADVVCVTEGALKAAVCFEAVKVCLFQLKHASL